VCRIIALDLFGSFSLAYFWIYGVIRFFEDFILTVEKDEE